MADLKSAYIVLDFAGKHLDDFKAACSRIIQAQADATILHYQREITVDPGETKPLVIVKSAFTPIPGECAYLAGLVALDLRCALDYLIAQLAALDGAPSVTASGRPIWRQFPIEDRPEKFADKSKTPLLGLTDSHKAAIERVQPYNGFEWLAHLRKMSNIHKHSDLVTLEHDYLVSVRAEPTKDSTDPDAIKMPMKVNIQPILRVMLRDSLPVIEMLEELKAKVAQTLEAFEPEFK